MKKEIIRPEDKDHWLRERSKDLTSTEISAVFGISPYLTALELWHNKKDGTIVKLEETERLRWGTRLQDSIANGIANDNNWMIRRADEYIRVPELRLGSSFDFMRCEVENDLAILEIKNVDSLQFKEKWDVDDEVIEAPPHIELQVQHQMLVSGLKQAYIGALVGGNRVILIEREADNGIQSAIIEKAKAFWKSIDENNAPAPIFPQDAAFVTRLYGHAEPNKVFDAKGNTVIKEIAEQYRKVTAEIEEAKERKESLKAQILMVVGDCEKLLGDGFSVSCGMIGPSTYTVNRDGYRNFRVNFPRAKK